ncbi:DNA polymerase III subunit alpha [Candidatus Poriferisodalis sp.]|uniref:DNA polymerase III subunit alpha n=1 Tax=Candidatus Poriferisodalis sp. TaxID=3101277 RepID=UPI003B012772
MAASFVHLHTHTEYSLLDGAARVGEVVAAAAADGQPALGITDHGNMYGVLDFYRACKAQGVKPIIGTEAYMAAESRHERPNRNRAKNAKVDDTGDDGEGGGKLYYHLTLLARSDAGYRNLLKLASRAFLEGYYYKPRMDWDMFADHAEGLVATTGCLGSVVQQALLAGDYDEARRRAGRLQDIFGRDSLYVELQDHGIGAQRDCNPQLLQIARDLGAPLLATNDLHYTHQHDALAHDALLCVQTGSLRTDADRFKFHGDQHYLKSAVEMRALFREFPEACDNTLAIAEQAETNIAFGRTLLPHFDVPAPHADADAYLEHLAFEGAKRRWGPNLSEDTAARIAYELRVVADMGFAGYFLITWDLIRHAREAGIRVGPGRGSAAGCAVAYCLGITELDPIKYGLVFERFLNPARVSMPDIDIDFDDRYRDEMIRYTAQTYGEEHVAQIITFSTIKARAAVRDAARVLGKAYSLGDRISKAMPPLIMGRDTPLGACLERDERHAEGYAAAAELRTMYSADPEVREVVDVARGLEGLIRQDSVHAAAVVISPEPLTNYLPIQRKPPTGTDPADAPIVTQFDMGGVEDLGLLKMDFLGLRTLSIIEETVRLVERSSGSRLDIDAVPLDDPATFELLRAGETMGVFQLESAPVRALLRTMAPTRFEDICALVALYRPGPMAADMHNSYAHRKNGRQPATPPHPDLAELLEETYGLMIYQESMMRVAQNIAGYSMAQADDLRKACGKKNREQIAEHRTKFVEGSVAKGYTAELGKQLFDIIEPFADYAFNKSHAFAYGLIAYQTAYLKANHLTEFLAAVLTGAKRNIDKAGVYLADCRQHGIDVLVPDINRSELDFATDGRSIPFGLSAVRNVGEKVAEPIIAERNANGPFRDFEDFCMRMPREVLNRRFVESLIKAGAFETCGHTRKGLLDVFDQVIEASLRRREEAAAGVQSLFGSAGAGGAGHAGANGSANGSAFDERIEIPDIEAGERDTLAWEKELLGLYVSDHPLRGGEAQLHRLVTCTVSGLGDLPPEHDGGQQWVTLGGVVQSLQRRPTRSGEPMARFMLEDLTGAVEVTVFPKVLAAAGEELAEDAVMIVRGRPDRRGEGDTTFLASELAPLALRKGTVPLLLNVERVDMDDRWLAQFEQLLNECPGDAPVHLRIGDKVVQLPEGRWVNAGNLAGPMRELLGADAVRT